MRYSCSLLSAALFVAAVSPMLVHAQFQDPTADELKMTSDPKAPGAAAVYLNIEEIANDPLHFQSYYARIKVLTEKGKELGTVELPYLRGSSKITDIKGRTIHADGTVIPLAVKPEDLLVAKSGEMQIEKKVFTLPSVEVGSILEYSYDIRYDDNLYSSPEWEIQQPYFVHRAHYVFTPFKEFMPNGTPDTATSQYLVDERGRAVNSLLWACRLPPNVTVQTSIKGFYSVDVTDVPAAPDEEWMPPSKSILYRLFFYYKAASDVKDFWISEGKLWSKDVDHFAEPSKPIKEAVDGLVAPGDSELDKAKKLYVAVQALDNTDYSRRKSESEMKELKLKTARHAEDTWAQKSGNSEDIAMLYLAMLRAAGLKAYAIKVVDRDRDILDLSYMSLNQLDTTLVVLATSDNKEFVLDPGEKMCPFGTTNWRHSDAEGLGQSAQGLSISTTAEQSYKTNIITRVGDLNVDAHGGVTGYVRITMNGQEALRWRQAALRNDESEVKKNFDRELEGLVPEGIEAHVDHFLGLDDPNTILLAVVKVNGTLGTATAKRLLLPGYFFGTRGHVPFVNEEKRLEPVDMHYGDTIINQVTYYLPQGISVEGAPQDADVSWPGHARFVAKSATAAGQITETDTLISGFTLAKPEEYQQLRGFYQKVAAADQEQLVLTTAPVVATGKGN